MDYVALSKDDSNFSFHGPSVRLQGGPSPGPRKRTTTVDRIRQANLTHTKKNLPVRERQDLITPKSFRRLNGVHIVRCKKKDLKLIKHRTNRKTA
ncbi:hypothetical protein AVEN_205333-1 [Araneus ventricosus]|uniref:60S ribosomal protein L28 n=1 Tax=Araneus ventricosus TaxID=182803 RepID=A0A4Y2LPQ2_ARAVE|nr:hypothetical protein AVEN_205333-1 [Araneus ventricosus]